MGVNIIDLFPPHLNPPPPRGEEVFFDSIGVEVKDKIVIKGSPDWEGLPSKPCYAVV
jgi:hypothetical protein